jgi:hypothetical protein
MKKLESLLPNQLEQLAKKVLRSYFYVFRVTTIEESMTLFERINARGLRLEVSDLIKTELFSFNIPEIDKKWEAVENATGDSPTKLLKYFFYTQGGHVTKKQLFKKMKTLAILPAERLDRICEFSEFYAAADVPSSSALKAKDQLLRFLEIIGATWLISNESKLNKLQESLIAIRAFGVTQHISLAYGMIRSAAKLSDTKCYDKLLKLLSNLEHYHYANTVICNKGGNDVEKLYATYAMKFTQIGYQAGSDLHEKYHKLADEFTKQLSDDFVKEGAFISEFSILDYEEEEDKSAILYAFDRLNNRNCSPSVIKTPIFRPYDGMQYKLVTLDHIYPQNPDSEVALESLHNIGNLVAISPGINSKLGNKLPKEKFDIIPTLDSADLAAFRVLKDLLDEYKKYAPSWDDTVVRSRADELGKKLYHEVLRLESFS